MALSYQGDRAAAMTLAYVRRYGIREHAVLKKCRLETLKARPDATMMTAPEEAAFLAFFVQAIGAQRGLEIGTFTGYSSLALALALPNDGQIVACEFDPDLAATARSYWDEAGVGHKMECRVGDAVSSLQNLIEEKVEPFDFAYIDANKESYDAYYEASLQLVRTGGTIMIDNMLWGGRVADRQDTHPTTLAIKALNEKLHTDERIELVLTTLGDGVTFARKR